MPQYFQRFTLSPDEQLAMHRADNPGIAWQGGEGDGGFYFKDAGQTFDTYDAARAAFDSPLRGREAGQAAVRAANPDYLFDWSETVNPTVRRADTGQVVRAGTNPSADSFVDKLGGALIYAGGLAITGGAAGFGPLAGADAAAGGVFTATPVEALTLPAVSENVITPTVAAAGAPVSVVEGGLGITASQVAQAGSVALKAAEGLQALKQRINAARVNGANGGGLVAPGFDRVNPVAPGVAGGTAQPQLVYLIAAGGAVLLLVLMATRR
jgi:hypothetical protein